MHLFHHRYRRFINFPEVWRYLLYISGFGLFVLFISLALTSEDTGTKVAVVSNGIVESQTKLIKKDQEISETKQELISISEDVSKTQKDKDDISAEIQALQDKINQQLNSFVNVTQSAPNSSGNMYAPGNCTWYVKSKRPDLPNNLGNANEWYYTALSEGFKVGKSPKVGAVGVSYEGYMGHVVYVEGLRGDNVVISEMNYGGLWNMNKRVVPASLFVYIYSL